MKKSILMSLAIILSLSLISCGDNSEKEQYVITSTKTMERADIKYNIPSSWKEAEMGEVTTPFMNDTFYLYDAYISENDNNSIAELLITDRDLSRATGYNIVDEDDFISSIDDVRNFFVKEWGEYFDYGTLIFDGEDDKIQLTLSDGKNMVTVYGSIPVEAIKKEVTKEDILVKLNKLGDTIYKYNNLDVVIDSGLFVPMSDCGVILDLRLFLGLRLKAFAWAGLCLDFAERATICQTEIIFIYEKQLTFPEENFTWPACGTES